MRDPIPKTQTDSLSQIHRDSLLFVWKVRQGLCYNTTIELLSDYCIWYWKNYISIYFAREEQALSLVLPQDDGMVRRLKEQRNDLRELFSELNHNPDFLLIGMLAGLFEFHIRFEQRIFYPYLEQRLSPVEFELLISRIAAIPGCNTPWKDEFWIPR